MSYDNDWCHYVSKHLVHGSDGNKYEMHEVHLGTIYCPARQGELDAAKMREDILVDVHLQLDQLIAEALKKNQDKKETND